MSRGNGITGPTGTKGKVSQKREDAYEAVSSSVHPGKVETALAYLAAHCNLPIPNSFAPDNLDGHAPSSKNPKKTYDWILSKESEVEAKAFVTLILSNKAWRKVIADLRRM